jgi:flagellar motor switch protein FliN
MNAPNEKSLNPKAPGDVPASQNVETPRSINFLLDIPLELTVEVGRRSMTMGELIELMPGTIVELDRPAGGQLDIMANGKIIAKGEAVVVGDRYGVRILEIIGDDPFNSSVADIPGGNQ